MSPTSSRAEPLTREAIVEAALRVTERSGLDRLTMRAVAADLGVSPMAIYYHLHDKDELVGEVITAVRQHWGPLVMGPDGWEATLRDYLLSMWQELTRYPGVSAYLIGTPTLGTTPRAIEAQVRFFEDAGFSHETAPLAWSAALTYIHGRLNVDARLTGARRQAIGNGLRRRDFVEFGVDTLVAGLRSMLEKEQAPTGSTRSNGSRRRTR